jgi:hypothetical protein
MLRYPSFGSVQGGGDSGPGFFAPRWYWEAFVAYDGRFDHVMVDGKPERWVRKDEAKAAAGLAYQMWLSDSASVTGEDDPRASQHEAADDQDRKATRVRGHFRSLVRAWRGVYRSDRETSVP